MPALYLTLAPLPRQGNPLSSVLSATRKASDSYGISATPSKVQGVVKHSLCSLLALGLCSIEALSTIQPAFAEGSHHGIQVEALHPFSECMLLSPATYSGVQLLHVHSVQESPSVTEERQETHVSAEQCHRLSMKILVFAADHQSSSIAMEAPVSSEGQESSAIALKNPVFAVDIKSTAMSIATRTNKTSLSDLFLISSTEAEDPKPFLDYAGVFSSAEAASLLRDINTLEAEAGWRLRVITKSGTVPSISGKDLKDLWKPDNRTVIVIEDISSPNILNFNAGADVVAKLPRQFFLELQSRYGNQFFVQQEGEGEALMSTVQAIEECLKRREGCKNVPGLTNDLYYLTLATSIAGGCVFGFAARLEPSGRVEASWQWVVFLSPLWLLLFVSFGVLPVIGRTSELEPLLKNALGFAVGAFALYLTPIFGPSPISKR